MNSNVRPAKGYYSILQYVPNLERVEGANIGVVLFCPEKRFLEVKLGGGNDRVRRFFDSENLDLERIKAMKNAFAERIHQQANTIITSEDFKLFVDTRANQLILTEPRPMKVFEPREDLAELCEKLVGGRHKTENKVLTDKIINQNFTELLEKRGIEKLVKRNVQIELPFFQKTERFPFYYENGQPNLVKITTFGSDENQSILKVCRLAVEGEGLAEKNYKLNVLAGFENENSTNQEIVQSLLGKYKVGFYSDSQMESLVEEIAVSAH